MAKLYPIIKSDIEIRSRSLSLPVSMTLANAVFFAVGLAASSGLLLRMRRNYTLEYGSFLTVYLAVVFLELLMLLFTAPLLTAGSISGERERGTYELLLTTSLSTTDILLEKMASAFASLCMLTISGLPALLVPLMFGGIHILNTFLLILVFILEGVLLLSAGIFASCLGHSSLKSIAVSYCLMLALTAGPVALAVISGVFAAPGMNGAYRLLALSPLLPVTALVLRQTGESALLLRFFTAINAAPDPGFLRHAALIGICVQLALALGFFALAVFRLMPRAGRSSL